MRRERPFTASLSDLTFQDLIGVFRRQVWVFLIILTIGLIGGVIYSLVQQRGFLSISQVLLEGSTQSSPNFVRNDAVSAVTESSDQIDVLTQIQIMQSSKVFFAALRTVGIPIPETQADVDRLPEVRVAQVGTTRILQLSVVADTPDRARGLADALIDNYASIRRVDQGRKVREAVQFVQNRIQSENQVLQRLQNDLATRRGQANVVDSVRETDARLQERIGAVNDMNRAIQAAEAARQRVASLRQSLQSLPRSVTVNTTQTNIEELQIEQRELAELEQSRAQLLVGYLEDAPQVRQIDERIAAKKARIASLQRNLQTTTVSRNPQIDVYEQNLASAEAELRAAEAAVNSARQIADTKSRDVESLSRVNADLQLLERQIAERAQSIERLSQTFDELRLRDNELQTPVEKVTPAQPARLIRPNWTVNLVIGALFGILLGVFAALLRDVGQDKVNTADQAVYVTEKDVLARIPLRSRSAEPVITDPARARAFEAYRQLRASVLLATANDNLGTFMVTSARPGEGKSAVASNFAVSLAMEGKRVILVDANLRNPILHKFFKLNEGKGLAEAVLDPTIVDDVLNETTFNGLKVLTAGEKVTNPTELLGSASMSKLVEILKSKADFVVFDTPSGFLYADAQALVPTVPTVLMVTDLLTPSKTDLRETVAMLDYAHANVLGLVLNKDKSASSRIG